MFVSAASYIERMDSLAIELSRNDCTVDRRLAILALLLDYTNMPKMRDFFSRTVISALEKAAKATNVEIQEQAAAVLMAFNSSRTLLGLRDFARNPIDTLCSQLHEQLTELKTLLDAPKSEQRELLVKSDQVKLMLKGLSHAGYSTEVSVIVTRIQEKYPDFSLAIAPPPLVFMDGAVGDPVSSPTPPPSPLTMRDVLTGPASRTRARLGQKREREEAPTGERPGLGEGWFSGAY